MKTPPPACSMGKTATVAVVAGVVLLAGYSTEAALVDAGTLTTVTVDAPLYDTNTLDDNGCDPAGCVGEYTRDGDAITPTSRWSCKPSLGPEGSICSITYSLGSTISIESLNIAMYKGDERTRIMDIYIDSVLINTWTSSGITAGFETVALGGSGDEVQLIGVLEDSEWLSLKEVEILVDDGSDSTVVEAGTLGDVTTSAALYDTRLSAGNGCDPAGCTASLARDGDLTDGSRWSCSPSLGGDCTISYDLGAVRDFYELKLAMYKGSTRTRTVQVYVDGDLISTWASSGTTDDFENIDISSVSGQLIEVTGVLGDSEWLSIIETEIMVIWTDDPQPSPGTSPGTTGNLEPVGLIPLASGDSDELNMFYAKDGDFSTAWTCTSDEADTDGNYECLLYFNLFTYRHVKQVKIALANGEEGPVDMRIGGRYSSNLFEEFVTSSGTTNDYETYDYDYFTNTISIAAIFASGGGSINVSEVEFVEEVQSGEVSVSNFDAPDDSNDGLWNEVTTDSFEWTSDSEEAWDRTLTFSLSTYSTLTAIELQFPIGETYIFDLELYDNRVTFSSTPTLNEDPHTTIESIESTDVEGWQSFDVSQYLEDGQYVAAITLVMRGTGSGEPGFYLLDARFIGSAVDNPTNEYYVASTFIDNWYYALYPDFVAERSGDQAAIMQAICAVKQASFDGVDCVGEDPDATGTVLLPIGQFHVNGSIFMKSGVLLNGRYTQDDHPYVTYFSVDEDVSDNADVNVILVMDGVSDAWIDDIWIRGLYDPDTSNANTAVDGLGTTCLSITNSQNITCQDVDIRFCDGDAMVVSNSSMINIDSGPYDDQTRPSTIGRSRGTGLIVNSCDSVWVRRHAMWDNGVAGIHIWGSNNFTFEATFGDDSSEGSGYVGSTDGQQPIEVIIESSNLVMFRNMSVRSTNDPVMTVSADSSTVGFDGCGFSQVDSGICVIQMEDPTVVTTEDDELALDGTCYVKV